MASNEFARHNKENQIRSSKIEKAVRTALIIGKKNKEINCSELSLPVDYLRNGKRYSSSVFTFGSMCKSHATKRYKRRLL